MHLVPIYKLTSFNFSNIYWQSRWQFLGKTLHYAVRYILKCRFSILCLGLILWSPIYEACILFNTNRVSLVNTTCSLRYLTQTSHVQKRIALCGTQQLISRSNHTRMNRMACTADTLKRTCTDITLRLTDFTGKITLGTTISKTNRTE